MSASLANDNFLSWLFAWIWISSMAIPIGRSCSLYFPYLVTGKIYYTVKSEKLQRFFISTYLNRGNPNATDPKDRDKLPLLGCIYYIVSIPLVITAYLSLIGFQITTMTLSEPLWFFDRMFWTVAPAYCLFAPIMGILYRFDYEIGRRIHDI
mgnify:FL=1